MWLDYGVEETGRGQLEGLPENLTVGFLLEGMSGEPSGTWTRFRAIVTALNAVGIEVHVRGLEGVHDSVHSLPVASCELVPKQSPLRRFLGRRKEIDDFARRTGVHIIHLEAPPFLSGKVAPSVASIHDLRHFYPTSRSLSTGEAFYQVFFLRNHIKNIPLILSLSPWASDEMERLVGIPAHKTKIVPPIVENPPRIEQSWQAGGPKYAIALGHLERRKNLEVIVAASGEASWPEDVELLIAGTNQGSLEELATTNCSANGKAVFLGSISDADKWTLLRGALVVLLPSLVEGFGIVAVEAPMVGTPVFVANTSGLEELGAHPSALLDPHSPKDWAEAVNAISLNADLRNDILAHQQSLAPKFSQEQVTSSLLDGYRKIIGSPRVGETLPTPRVSNAKNRSKAS